MLKYSWNERRRRSRSLLVAVSLSMVPIVYPVLHAHISYSFIIYVITHAWTVPRKAPPSLAIAGGRLALSGHYARSSTAPPFPTSSPHMHLWPEACAHTRAYAREKKLSSLRRRGDRGSAIIVRLPSSTPLLREKMEKNRSVVLGFSPPPPRITPAALTRIYKKLRHICERCPPRTARAARLRVTYGGRKLPILRIKCPVYLS